jgi:hypothetical protein
VSLRGIVALMRAILFLIIALVAAPAVAEDWTQYSNPRFGYSIDVPASFATVRDSDNGDGRSYRDGATRLAVWGGNIVDDSFESAAFAASGLAAGEGWGITYEAVTPSWASFSGTQGQRVLYQRMVVLCGGQYAAFRLEYSAVDMARLDSVVSRLVQSLKGGC